MNLKMIYARLLIRWNSASARVDNTIRRRYNLVRGHPQAQALEPRSWYDPQVEFMEIRVEQGAEKWWKIYGPDASGSYGGVQGIGGLLGLAKVDGSERIHVMQDFHGHVIGYTRNAGGSWTWSTTGKSKGSMFNFQID